MKLNLPHLDAAENIFFQRELEHILAESLDTKYAPMKAMQFVPIDSNIPAGDQTFTYTQYSKLGQAKVVKSYADDVENVNVSGSQSSQSMQGYAAGFNYSIDELRAAAKNNKPLERMRAEAAKKAIDVLTDQILAVGDSTYGLSGLLNLSSTNSYTPSTKAAGGTAWIVGGVTVATADEVLGDLNGAVRKVVVDSLETERPTLILLDTESFEMISNTPRSTTSDTTIKNFFLLNNPGIRIESWSRCSTAGSGSVKRMVAYDPTLLNVRGLMPIVFEQMAPQLKNAAYQVNCYMKTGGVISPYPKSICYVDGI